MRASDRLRSGPRPVVSLKCQEMLEVLLNAPGPLRRRGARASDASCRRAIRRARELPRPSAARAAARAARQTRRCRRLRSSCCSEADGRRTGPGVRNAAKLSSMTSAVDEVAAVRATRSKMTSTRSGEGEQAAAMDGRLERYRPSASQLTRFCIQTSGK